MKLIKDGREDKFPKITMIKASIFLQNFNRDARLDSLLFVALERSIVRYQRISPEIIFNEKTPVPDSQNNFLSNLANKQRLINQLKEKLECASFQALSAIDDADTLIVQTAIKEAYNSHTVVVVGQDVDLLILIIALCPLDKDVRFLRDVQGNIKERAYSSLDIQNSEVLYNCKNNILFAHAFSGCDTTSAFFGKGKAQTVKLINTRRDLDDALNIFNNPSSMKPDIVRAGEKITLALYKAPRTVTSLNQYRFISFNKFVGQSNQAVLLSKLPPTSAALGQHSYRVFQQIHSWRGKILKPNDWGWKSVRKILVPNPTTEIPAPTFILKLISCNCKKGCGKRCGCAKVGLKCSTMCSSCHGQGCLNSLVEEELPEDNPIIE